MNSDSKGGPGGRDDVCVDIVAEVARLAKTDPLSLPPLQRAVDVDALTTLVGDADGDGGVSVSFAYEGFRVTATDDGTFEVTDERSDSSDDGRAVTTRNRSDIADSPTRDGTSD